MRLLLLIAAAAILYVAVPAHADAAAKRAGKPRVAPKAQCAETAARRPSRARRRALVRRGCLPSRRRLVGESRAGVIGAPGSFAAAAPFDLIFANILLRPLQQLAAPLARLVSPGGRLVLSGLLRSQGTAALATYRAQGLVLERRLLVEDWATLVLRRPARVR